MGVKVDFGVDITIGDPSKDISDFVGNAYREVTRGINNVGRELTQRTGGIGRTLGGIANDLNDNPGGLSLAILTAGTSAIWMEGIEEGVKGLRDLTGVTAMEESLAKQAAMARKEAQQSLITQQMMQRQEAIRGDAPAIFLGVKNNPNIGINDNTTGVNTSKNTGVQY